MARSGQRARFKLPGKGYFVGGTRPVQKSKGGSTHGGAACKRRRLRNTNIR